ncbi:MAG: metallophosphoesterase [Scytolyngbya sp. HA4215-MV1]|nr:metallophosphoesterase [Scytolyngbya sp. HA4215-MV1]
MHRLLTGPLSVETVTVPIAGLPEKLRGTKLVQLSDLHYDGVRLSEKLLAEAIAACNFVEPDLVVFTGDLITDDPTPIHQLAQRLKQLQSRAGMFAVLGNHDNCLHVSRKLLSQTLGNAGIQVLWNEIAYPLGAELALVGLADYWSGQFNPAPLIAQIDQAIPRIVLSHNPDTAAVLKKWRVDLQLSGHTHGGQIVLPGVGNASELYQNLQRKIPKRIRRCIPFLRKKHRVVQHWEWASGLHRVNDNFLYVNRGLGSYFPGRFFCPPEVTVITLV